MDFLVKYRTQLTDNRKKFSDLAGRLQKGLVSIEKATVEVSDMQAELEIKQVEVNKNKADVEVILDTVSKKTSEVTTKKENAGIK